MSERETLLDEVLGAPDGFRETMLEETLRRARRKRIRRSMTRVGVAGVAMAIIVAFITRHDGEQRRERWRDVTACPVVETRPFGADAIVTTRTFDPKAIVVSEPTVAVVRTTPAQGRVRWLNDEELLALAQPRRAILMRAGPGAQTLIFVEESGTPERGRAN